jgi:hypothetical protein
MNRYDAHAVRMARTVLAMASLALLASCGGNSCIGLGTSCGTGNATPTVSVSGTAATGKALASATIGLSCVGGSGSTVADSGGNYSVTVNGTAPCILSATSGSTLLHSVAYASGTFNITPETELMLPYLAAQLGTNESTLIADFASNASYQQALANASDVLAAQSAVVTNLQTGYQLTLAVPSFLTTLFVVGQAGVDSDLTALQNAGALDSSGMPTSAAVSLLTAAGQAHPLAAAAAQ